MTGPEHYREAERLLHVLGDTDTLVDQVARLTPEQVQGLISGITARAQVHATLALAAATAQGASPGGGYDTGPHMPSDDANAWQEVAGVRPS
jgi:hypothetical protein